MSKINPMSSPNVSIEDPDSIGAIINRPLLDSRLKYSGMTEIIFIVGPTAVGKTEIALLLAQKLSAEIISCDAMQVYKEINIASAKPTKKDLAKVPHHCLNLVSVTESFDAAQFRREAWKALQNIYQRGKRVVMAGGSGMYVSVLLDGLFEEPAKDENLRRQLEADIRREGTFVLHQRLKTLDAKAAAKIHANDARRIIRALEVILTTQKPISKLQQERRGWWGQYTIQIFGLNRPRAELYRRAQERIDQMFKQGLVQEVKRISKLSLSATAKAMIGVPEVQGFLRGEYDLERAKYLMKLHTRHYIKRQLTWFRRDKRIEWIDA